MATFVNTIGNGLFLASSALYFTRVVGMSAPRVGLGLTIGALVGLVAGPLVGHLADRWGPRGVHIGSMVCGAVATACFVAARTFPSFVLVACLTSLALAASAASRAPLIRGFGGAEPTRFQAYLRSVTNLGMTVGALIAGIGIALDTKPAYVAMVLGNAVSFLGCAAVLTWLPRLPPMSAAAGHRRWAALRDGPYLTVTLLNGVMSLHYGVLAFALPLWIVGHTQAPRWLVWTALTVNTVMVVALQVPASRGVTDSRAAGQRMSWAGLALVAAMALVAAASGLPAQEATVVLVLAVTVHTLGELWQSAASFQLSFGLAPAHAQGQYSGVFGLGPGLGTAVAPAVLGVMCLSWGQPGWLAFGVLLAVVGLLTPVVVRWAARTRFVPAA
ncbi:MAG TPA: MFS transporter [Pilimelia sp.]|nr:MFS transporter [Pilimelia sp.]